MSLNILETRSVSATNLVEFERTGMFSSPLSLNVRHKVTLSRAQYFHHLTKNRNWWSIHYDKWAHINAIAPCTPDHNLVRAGLLPAEPESFSIGREVMYSPNLPGVAVYSDTQFDVFLIPAPARPEGCPIHLWFPFRDSDIGKVHFDMHASLTVLGSEAYARQKGTHMTLTPEGTFPGRPFNIPYATGVASWDDDSFVEFIIFTAKRLWLFRPNQRDLVRIAPPFDKKDIVRDLNLPYKY